MEATEIETPGTPAVRQESASSARSGGGALLVQPDEVGVYIQRSRVQVDDLINFVTNAVEPTTRFNIPKPPGLRLSDDTWAALQLRVDPLARGILDPHRYYAAAGCVGFLITIVFYAIRPGYDQRKIHAAVDKEDQNQEDDEIYDDYIQDDLWERNHSMDDVVVAELDYLNSQLAKSLWIWRCGLIISILVLFGSVAFLVVLMERRNQIIDAEIRLCIGEIAPRVEDEGLAVEYRTRSMLPGRLTFLSKYIRPTRVVVFRLLDGPTPRALEGGTGRTKGSFFSEDYQRRYFPPRSTDEFSATMASSTFSII
ncbi:hypothetical protein ACHAXT_002199 [Thalassiosira profunda]